MNYDLVLKGRCVLATGIVDGCWIAVADGRIAALGLGAPPAAAKFIDAGADLIVPGLVDGQTHATSYAGLPGFEATSRSALAGGITTIVDMPYDNPDPLNTPARLEAKIAAIHAHSHCDVALYGTVAPGQGVAGMAALAEAGVCAFKISSIESHPVRFPRLPADETLEILEASVALGLPVGLHNEDQEIVRAHIARHREAGLTAPRYHEPSRPEAAELSATAQFLELGAATGAHAHIVHISTPKGFAMVRDYAARGARATGEICVHYLHFDNDRDITRLGARMKVSPPLRSGYIDALWQAVEADEVAFISSDHSSWPVDNKLVPSIFDAGAGIPGLETLGPSFYTDAEKRFGPDGAVVRLVEHVSRRPAAFFGLWPRKGEIRVGADADLAVLRRGERRFDASRTHDGLNWSPYDGETFSIAVMMTLRRGAVVFEDGRITSAPGSGRFIPRAARP